MMKNKKDNELYLKTDTHWNSLGAFYACQAMISHIQMHFPGIKSASIQDYYREPYRRKTDLSRMLMLNEVGPEETFRLISKSKNTVEYDLDAEKAVDTQIQASQLCSQNKNGVRNKVLVFRDSFFTDIIPFFSERFESVVYMSKKFDAEDVKREKPDLIIDGFVERRL
jgi:hypothetical protein